MDQPLKHQEPVRNTARPDEGQEKDNGKGTSMGFEDPQGNEGFIMGLKVFMHFKDIP